MSKTALSHRLSYHSLRHLPAFALAGVLLTGVSAQAQSPVVLSMTPIASTVNVGSTVTFTVNLTGGTNVGAYGFNVFIDTTKLAFVGTAPYTNLDSFFSNAVTNFLPTSNDLMVNYGVPAGSTAGTNNVGPTALGSFQVKVLSALPLTGSAVSFGAPGNAVMGGSEVDNFSTQANELTAVTGATLLTPTPEPSQDAALGLGLLGLSALALTARRRLAAGRKA